VRTSHSVALPLALIAAALLSASCDNSVGLFASIQEETKQNGSSPFEEAAVSRAFRYNGAYYAQQAKLRSRAVGSDSWSVVPINGSKDYTCFSVAGNGDTAYYVSLENASGGNVVYRYDGSWTALDTSAFPADSVADNLFFVNGYLFAECHENYSNADDENDDRYTLYYSFGGSAFTKVGAADELTSLSAPFVGAAYYGTTYYCATSSTVYSFTAVTGTVAAVTGPSGTFTCLAYSSVANALYVGTDSDKLWQYDGSSWASTSPFDSHEPVTAVVEVGSSSSHLLVGVGFKSSYSTEGGYYEGSFSSLGYGDDGAVAHSSSVFDTTVYGTAVNSFFWDGSANTLFVCVSPGASSSLYGLYASTYDGSSWSGWDAE